MAVLVALGAGAQQTNPGKAEGATGVVVAETTAFVQMLAQNMGSKNARLRFAVREALVVIGRQALAGLNQKKADTKNEHVKAFIDRTIARIKSLKTNKLGYTYPTKRGRDLDRLAMQCNLTLEQVAKIEPALAKFDKNRKELWDEFRESGAYGDPEARKDLDEEMNLLVEETGSALRKYLDPGQVKTLTQKLKPPKFGGMAGGVRVIGGPGGGTFRIRRAGGGEGKGK
jgi:hypothetical protein